MSSSSSDSDEGLDRVIERLARAIEEQDRASSDSDEGLDRVIERLERAIEEQDRASSDSDEGLDRVIEELIRVSDRALIAKAKEHQAIENLESLKKEKIESATNVNTSSAAVMSLEEYAESIEIPIEEIESATNNFADENLVKQTPSSKIYKGRLKMQSSSSSGGGGEFFINIVARIFMQDETANNEFRMLKDLRHKHILPIFKLAITVDDKGVLIYKREANESLDKHLSSCTLTWMQRLHICVGIADALKYLHYDAQDNHNKYVIHGNIKSSKILLDHHWEPKLHGFRFAVRAIRNQICLADKHEGSLQYMDPAYENTGGLTHKSDVFSFGVVLFEVLFGRDASSRYII